MKHPKPWRHSRSPHVFLERVASASLFVLSSLHASSSTSLEVAVGGISVSSNSSAGNASTSIGSMQVQAGAAAGISRNASELESNISDDAWGVTDTTQETGGNTVWEACRYYEVGNIEEELRNVLSNSTMCQGEEDKYSLHTMSGRD